MSLARVLHVSAMPEGLCQIVGTAEGEQVIACAPGLVPRAGDIVALNTAGNRAERIAGSPDAWTTAGDGMRWRRPGSDGRRRMDILRQRHSIRTAIRAYLDSQGFIEIDTPLVVHGTTPDPALASFAIEDRCLVTSTEYQIKRMEAGGFDQVYTLTQNYRAGDLSPRHNPEFTMLEWARVGGTLADIEGDVEAMVCCAHQALGGGDHLTYQSHVIDLTRPWPHLTVAHAVEQVTGVPLPDFSLTSIRHAVEAAAIPVRAEWLEDRVILFAMLADHLQGHLGVGRPVFLTEWPYFQTASTTGRDQTDTADRSELFIAGLELSDGFPTLTDHALQVKAFERQAKRREIEGLPPVALDESYLRALRLGMPPGAGMALGFDRLVMLLTDQISIRATLAFAWDEV